MKKNELKNKIRNDILSGDYDDECGGSTKLPSENKLAERFNVSRSTIREVLALLTQEGLVYKVNGKGSFIRKDISTLNFNINNLYSINSAIKRIGAKPTSELLSINKVIANDIILNKLSLEDKSHCIEIKRIRYADGNVAVYSEHYFRMDSGINIEEIKSCESIFEYFQEKGVYVSYSKAKIKSAILTKHQVCQLNSEIKTFLLLDEIFYTEKGEIIGCTNDYYCDDVFSFDVIRKRI